MLLRQREATGCWAAPTWASPAGTKSHHPTLLSAGWATPAVAHLVWVPATPKSCGQAGKGPEKGHEDDPRAGSCSWGDSDWTQEENFSRWGQSATRILSPGRWWIKIRLDRALGMSRLCFSPEGGSRWSLRSLAARCSVTPRSPPAPGCTELPPGRAGGDPARVSHGRSAPSAGSTAARPGHHVPRRPATSRPRPGRGWPGGSVGDLFGEPQEGERVNSEREKSEGGGKKIGASQIFHVPHYWWSPSSLVPTGLKPPQQLCVPALFPLCRCCEIPLYSVSRFSRSDTRFFLFSDAIRDGQAASSRAAQIFLPAPQMPNPGGERQGTGCTTYLFVFVKLIRLFSA